MINIKRVAWELELKVKGNTLKYKQKLDDWQWLNREETLELQQARLKALLKHAYYHVPYYRKLLQENGVVDAKGNVHMSQFHRLPLLCKDTIKHHFEALKSDDLDSRTPFEESSGGSTGVPITLIQDKEFLDWSLAVKMLDDEWTGLAMGGRRAFVWGSVRDTLVGKETVKTYLGRWMRNERWLNSFRMTQDRMNEFIAELNEFKPVQITAFAENLYDLAKFIEERGLYIYTPKAVLTSAGVLYPHMRETIQRVFKAPVFNRYGSREVGDIACECDHHNGLHTSTVTHYVEILDENGRPVKPGEYGEIVITLLTNYAMPLIRYRIGDMGVMSDESCSCGRGMPLLKDVIGRTTDIFINKNGDRIDGRMFIRLLMSSAFIQKFQVIQERYDRIKIVVDPAVKKLDHYKVYAKEIERLVEDARIIMGGDCEVGFEFVDYIETTASGKYRFTISMVH
ncbi:phenylacetate-CoA ligase [Paenibacillus taihuensis]|uniref:Phenylacetate-CoA ligase n=1 Tax=Paenibacillus taihuensis TaxID=1156355 RepID=A0A3D9Q7F5_9BACL|nr:phenylacetate--CoA ligase family protein [Paenibacillus taihuensis]REE57518.1 phenylacetate-CoA ligase [Paenibacillus taihuensis]